MTIENMILEMDEALAVADGAADYGDERLAVSAFCEAERLAEEIDALVEVDAAIRALNAIA